MSKSTPVPIEKRIEIAIERLRMFCPHEGYYLAFSGGKDSQVLYDLAVRAGVRFDAHYNWTTVDPPEVVRFIRLHYPTVSVDRPEHTMWKAIVAHGCPPTRRIRFCCAELKERGGHGRICAVGVRAQESAGRKNRKVVEHCLRDTSKVYVSPIIDWSDADVWAYHERYIPEHCVLYDEGWKRIGCVLCPNNRHPERDIMRWPKIAENYRRACHRAYARRLARGLRTTWTSGDDMFFWWLNGMIYNPKKLKPLVFNHETYEMLLRGINPRDVD